MRPGYHLTGVYALRRSPCTGNHCRHQECAWRRHIVAHILRRRGWFLKEIAIVVQRHHSSVVHHLKGWCSCEAWWERHQRALKAAA